MPVPMQGMDIAAWLRGLGLERYVQAFRAGEVTAETLPELADTDLRELGLPLGPRKVVLRAIRDLTCPSTTRVVAAPSTPSVPPEAERRRLTLMFCDLVGSTALSRRLDPEEMREVLRAYQNAVAAEIARLGGHVAKLMGDGVLAYFGWPNAHEDEAERAAQAGLACAEAVGRLAVPGAEALAARIGIATGLVVVGDLAGEGEAQEEVVIGETPNLAARLQELAAPGEVVVADGTRRLLGSLFDIEDLGPRALKGFVEPVRAWRIAGPGHVEGRFGALRGAGLVPLVGRERELALLLDAWAGAAGGEGRIALLTGEPGIGARRQRSWPVRDTGGGRSGQLEGGRSPTVG
jgi:class 3 adenylate cyclase